MPASGLTNAQAGATATRPTDMLSVCGRASRSHVVCDRESGDVHDLGEAEGVDVLVHGLPKEVYPTVARRLKVLPKDRSSSKRCRRRAETCSNVDLGVGVCHELSRLIGGSTPTNRGGQRTS